MTTWTTFTLGELGRVVTGRTPPSSQMQHFTGEVPFLTPTDIDGEHRLITTGRTVSVTWDQQQSRISLPPGTVCVVCIGATIGKVCLTSARSQSNQQINSIVVDEHRFDPLFVYYRVRLMKEELRKRAAGAATPILNKSAFSTIEIEAPTLDVQRRIGSILGAYDDLIEVNRRRASLLEEMARRLYDEWFVRFRFPGHEGNAAVQTLEGPLPPKWTMRPLSEIAKPVGESISPGSTPDQYFDHFSFPAFDKGQLPLRERGHTILSNKLVFTGPCVLIGKLNPRIPRIWYVAARASDVPQIASTEFVPLKPNASIPVSLLYAYATSAKVAGALRSYSQGTSTSHQRVRPGDALRITVPVPNEEIISLAGQNLSPVFEMVENLRRANAQLAMSRDLLLPRLILGDLSLPKAERELEAVA